MGFTVGSAVDEGFGAVSAMSGAVLGWVLSGREDNLAGDLARLSGGALAGLFNKVAEADRRNGYLGKLGQSAATTLRDATSLSMVQMSAEQDWTAKLGDATRKLDIAQSRLVSGSVVTSERLDTLNSEVNAALAGVEEILSCFKDKRFQKAFGKDEASAFASAAASLRKSLQTLRKSVGDIEGRSDKLEKGRSCTRQN
eukprot:scaffold83_cov246-Pinguiococcus_pyrenoidosus.AAC.15